MSCTLVESEARSAKQSQSRNEEPIGKVWCRAMEGYYIATQEIAYELE